MDFPSVKRAWFMKIDFTSLQAKINVDLKMQILNPTIEKCNDNALSNNHFDKFCVTCSIFSRLFCKNGISICKSSNRSNLHKPKFR